MRNIHLPNAIYEHLPKIYLLLALLLIVTPLGAFKWLLVLGLVVGAALIRGRRRDYREALRLRALRARMKKYRSRDESRTESHPAVLVI